MKKMISLVLFVGLNAAAEAPSPLVRAFFDQAKEIQGVRRECGTVIGDIQSKEDLPGVYTHTFILSQNRGFGVLEEVCEVKIMQDFRPLQVDGPIEYSQRVSYLK